MAEPLHRNQAERSRAMRARLIDATLQSLIEQGHARTTAVEICRRAGVTRGALHHHFADLAELLVAAMDEAFDRYFKPEGPYPWTTIEEWIDAVWARVQQPEFKAVIEIWLAARNEPDLAVGLRPAIARYERIFSLNETLQKKLGDGDDVLPFYRLVVETMVGLALGRALTPEGRAHEDSVVAQLKRFSRLIGNQARA